MFILALLDVSSCMAQQTQLGLTLLECAKSAVEQLLEGRRKEGLAQRDQYMLVIAADTPLRPNSSSHTQVVCGWHDNARFLTATQSRPTTSSRTACRVIQLVAQSSSPVRRLSLHRHHRLPRPAQPLQSTQRHRQLRSWPHTQLQRTRTSATAHHRPARPTSARSSTTQLHFHAFQPPCRRLLHCAVPLGPALVCCRAALTTATERLAVAISELVGHQSKWQRKGASDCSSLFPISVFDQRSGGRRAASRPLLPPLPRCCPTWTH